MPAVIGIDGQLHFYREGLRHRAEGKPATLFNGHRTVNTYWYVDGVLIKGSPIPGIMSSPDGGHMFIRPKGWETWPVERRKEEWNKGELDPS